MAQTFTEQTGDGDATVNFTFPSYQSSDVKVRVDGVLKDAGTHYNIINYTTTGGGDVVFTSGNIPSSPALIRIYRDTNVDAAKATYTAGSSVKAADLNNNNTQLLYRAQEEQVPNLIQSYDIAASGIETSNIKDDAITNAKLADNAVVTENILDGQVDAVKLNQNSGSEAVVTNAIRANAVTNAKLADNAVDSRNYVDGSIDRVHLEADIIDSTKLADDSINSEHYVDASINTAHIANSAVTSNKIANNAVTTTEILNGAVTTAKLAADSVTNAKIANNSIDSEHYVDGSIDTAHIADDAVTNAKVADDAIHTEQIMDGQVDAIKLNQSSGSEAVVTNAIRDNAVTTAKIATNAVTDNEIATGTLDNRYYTKAQSDAAYFNVSTGDTIKNGDSFPDNDTTIATTAAINDRIVDLVEEVGGFRPIANETSFPTSNPDVNAQHGQQAGRLGGTIISVKEASTNLVPSGTTVTIANGAGTGNTVTITGVPSTIPSGFGFLVETTATTHTYAFHRLTPKATEVTAVAGKATEIGRLGTAAAVADMAILGTADVVADLNTLGTADVVADMNTLGTADVVADMNTLAVTSVVNNMDTVASAVTNVNNVGGSIANVNTTAGSIANVNTVAGSIANVNTVGGAISNVNSVGGSISNVNTVASNISSVNNFANQYRIGANNPTTSLDTGDLFFNTTSNSLKVYTGSAWVDGVTATGNFAVVTGNTFTGSNRYNDNAKAEFGTGADLQIFHDGTNSRIENDVTNLFIQSNLINLTNHDGSEVLINANANGSVNLYYDNATRLSTTSYGLNIVGDARWGDTRKATFGDNGTDLQIFHDGTNSNIYNATGEFKIRGNDVRLMNAAGNEHMLIGTANGSVALYHDNSKKLETYSAGTEILGNLRLQSGGAYLSDNVKAHFGNSSDLQIYHDPATGGSSFIDATGTLQIHTSELYINNEANTERMIRCVQDGAVELYFNGGKKLHTVNSGVEILGAESTNAELFISADEGDDNSDKWKFVAFAAPTGEFLLSNYTSGSWESSIKAIGNGAVELYHNDSKKLETTSDGSTVYGKLSFGGSGTAIKANDDRTIELGNSSDLQLEHTGGANTIGAAAGQYLYIYADELRLNSKTGTEKYVSGSLNGAVELYHDNSKRFETTSTGGSITGRLTVRGANDTTFDHVGVLNLTGTDAFNSGNAGSGINFVGKYNSSGSTTQFAQISGIKEDTGDGTYDAALTFGVRNDAEGVNIERVRITSAGNLRIPKDNARLQIGAGQDLELYHNGSNSIIDSNTGNLEITSDSFYVNNAANNENMIRATANAGVKLYYNNSNKFETTSSGATLTGDLNVSNDVLISSTGEFYGYDNAKLVLGHGRDLSIYHDGSDSRIQDSTNLKITTNNLVALNYAESQYILRGLNGAQVELYHAGNKKLETTSSGIDVTGACGCDSLNVNSSLGNNGKLAVKMDSNKHIAFSSTQSEVSNVPALVAFQDNGSLQSMGFRGVDLRFATGSAQRWSIDGTGHFRPQVNNTYDIGTSSYRVRNIYTNDLHLSNKGHQNDVDGTWGDWTMQEGESDLFLKNNRSGKKYKFNLTEVS